MLFSSFQAKLREEINILGTFCLSCLQRATGHFRSGHRSGPKLKSGGRGTQANLVAGQSKFLFGAHLDSPKMYPTGSSVALLHFFN